MNANLSVGLESKPSQQSDNEGSLSIKGLFDYLYEHLAINQELARNLYEFQIGFVNKNSEHMEFFGGNLTGVHIVRFTQSDFDSFYDLLEIDDDSIRAAISRLSEIQLDRNLDLSINESFLVSSHPFNLTCSYLLHRFRTEKGFSERQRDRAMLDIALILNYRHLTSFLASYYIYRADIRTAEAVYTALSNKFLLKRLKTWMNVMVYRSEEIIKKGGLWDRTIVDYYPDDSIIKFVNDCQGRIRDMMKNIMRVTMEIKKQNEMITMTSNTRLDINGNEVIKDRTKGMVVHVGYLNQIVGDFSTFVKPDLISLVGEVIKTCPTEQLYTVLEWINQQALTHSHKAIDELLSLTITVSFNYLLTHDFHLEGKIRVGTFLIKLKGCYMSAKGKDPELLQLRDIGFRMVKTAIPKVNKQDGIAIRTGLFLYLSLRTYVRQHFQE